MAVLDALSTLLADQTSMKVHEAVFLLGSDGDLPRMRLGKPDLTRHALFRTPAGLYLCELHAASNDNFVAKITAGDIDVGELERIDPKTEITIEGNWPSAKVEINGTYFAVPRNFAKPLSDMLTAAREKRRRR